jgi:hypothetical protein
MSEAGRQRGEGDTVEASRSPRDLRSPRAAAIAGIGFALLLGAAFVLVRLAAPVDARESPSWLNDDRHKDAVLLALLLVPFRRARVPVVHRSRSRPDR